MLILYSTAHCSRMAEYIDSYTKTIEKTTGTGVGKVSTVWCSISVK